MTEGIWWSCMDDIRLECYYCILTVIVVTDAFLERCDRHYGFLRRDDPSGGLCRRRTMTGYSQRSRAAMDAFFGRNVTRQQDILTGRPITRKPLQLTRLKKRLPMMNVTGWNEKSSSSSAAEIMMVTESAARGNRLLLFIYHSPR